MRNRTVGAIVTGVVAAAFCSLAVLAAYGYFEAECYGPRSCPSNGCGPEVQQACTVSTAILGATIVGTVALVLVAVVRFMRKADKLALESRVLFPPG